MTEMAKLAEMLTKAEIPFETHYMDPLYSFNGKDRLPQIFYPSRENPICDAICHKYSYGGEKGLLEIMGLVDEEEVGDSVEGHLTADEVFRRIKEDFEKRA